MSILGTRVLRTEDPGFLTRGATYLADLRDPRLAGALSVAFVRSPVANGRLTSVDVSEARGAPGVVGAYAAADLELPVAAAGVAPPETGQPPLATDRVLFVGQPVAVVVAETEARALDGAELVFVDVESEPALLDLEAAARDETLLHAGTRTNTVFQLGDDASADLFEGCDVVVRQTLMNQRVAPCPLEGRAAAAVWIDGRLILFLSTQAAHGNRSSFAEYFELEPEQIRVIAPDVGGGFGPKIGDYAEYYIVAALARELGRPVRWIENRSEGMVAMGHGRAQLQEIAIGGHRDGRVLSYRLEVLADAGAYPSIGAALPFLTAMMAPGTYDIARVETHVRTVVTNTTPTVAYRGAGRPEASAAVERAMDLFAAEIGMDAADVRRRNLVAPFTEPFTTAVGTIYDVGDYGDALERVLDAAGYDGLRAEQERRRASGDPVALGIGISTYVEVTAGPGNNEQEYAEIEITDQGEAIVYTGSSAHGQGHHTAFAMLVQEGLGIPMDRVRVVHGDTDLVSEGIGTFGSRSLQLGGSAVQAAGEAVTQRARRLAAEQLEADLADVVLDLGSGTFHVTGTPAVSRSWAELAAAAGDLRDSVTFTASSPSYPFGAHVAVVEVDTDTGRVTLRRMVTCDDAGRILNPLLVEGQRHGGIAQGVAQALMEEVRYDGDGNPQTANLADYAMISAAELPSFELVTMETPTPLNPLGAKGIGESGTIGSTPAVQSAVCDALAHLGVRHVDMPFSPERIWRAIHGGG